MLAPRRQAAKEKEFPPPLCALASWRELFLSFTHDDDGNLLSDGKWDYTWDGENRLVKAEISSAALAGGLPNGGSYNFTYDDRGRCVRKLVSGSASEDTLFVYDGWEMIVERYDAGYPNPVRKTYVWGLDVSGTRAGAGGVGGLIAMNVASGEDEYEVLYGYDANGNVVDLIDGTPEGPSGERIGTYEYDAFGNVLAASPDPDNGWLMGDNSFLFSTKYWPRMRQIDYMFYPLDLGAYNFGIRWYKPMDARWMSRDPIGEKGGVNLYGTGNDMVNFIDPWGLKPCEIVTFVGHNTDIANAAKDYYKNGLDDCSRIAGLGCRLPGPNPNVDINNGLGGKYPIVRGLPKLPGGVKRPTDESRGTEAADSLQNTSNLILQRQNQIQEQAGSNTPVSDAYGRPGHINSETWKDMKAVDQYKAVLEGFIKQMNADAVKLCADKTKCPCPKIELRLQFLDNDVITKENFLRDMGGIGSNNPTSGLQLYAPGARVEGDNIIWEYPCPRKP